MHSYIAVVHVDGNGMGQRIMDIGTAHMTSESNRSYVNALRGFSDGVAKASQAALKATLAQLGAKIRDGKIIHPTLPKVSVALAIDKDTHKALLPFRPIVVGGDDVTFVCDGRLGLSLAFEYLRQFEDETVKSPACNGRITASAGIAMVKTHYPFARAYGLAEELCKSAKTYRRKQKLEGSCLDWHFALGGLAGDIDHIRERDTVKTGRLTVRPVTLDKRLPGTDQECSWEVVWQGIRAFQDLPPTTSPDERPKWSVRRNKVKALRDALREGESAVERFRTAFNKEEKLPDVGLGDDCREKGWYGDRCPYFDAIELADWFIPLEGGESHDAAASSGTQK